MVQRDEEIIKEHDLVIKLEIKRGDEESKVIIMEPWLQTSNFKIMKAKVAT